MSRVNMAVSIIFLECINVTLEDASSTLHVKCVQNFSWKRCRLTSNSKELILILQHKKEPHHKQKTAQMNCSLC